MNNFNDWSYTLSGEPELLAGRGFTGHEQLSPFGGAGGGLYNMNGRLYDPVVGRFLSADNYVQALGFTQSFNRYSYCLNNPLVYTDPSGEKWRWGNPFYHFDRLMVKLFDWINKKAEPVNDFLVEINAPAFGGGINSATGTFHYIGNSGNMYHRLPGQMAKADQKVYKKINEVRQAYGQAWREASSVGLLPPVDIKYPITSPYNEGNRAIPELGLNRPHLAIDIGTPVGTPVLSPWSGTVVMAQDTKYGLSVIVKHDYYHDNNYIQTGYAHLSKINISSGLQIQRGDTIGFTGTWGTGPHLHFTLRIGERKVNPTILFPYY